MVRRGIPNTPLTESSRLGLDADRELAEVATKFHILGRSQEQIAREYGVHPSTISRALKKARDRGIVKIEITRPARKLDDVAVVLNERFNIRRAVVVDIGEYSARLLGSAAGTFVQPLLAEGTIVALEWGSTLQEAVRALTPGSVAGIRVCQLCGGFPIGVSGRETGDLVRAVLDVYPDAVGHYLTAPLIVGSPSLRDALLIDESVRACLGEARRADIALTGVGAVDENLAVYTYGMVTRSDLTRLQAHGAVGEMCARFIAIDGREVADELSGRVVGVTLEDLTGVGNVIAVAGGERKLRAIYGACMSGVVATLVTDGATARGLIRMSDQFRAEGSYPHPVLSVAR